MDREGAAGALFESPGDIQDGPAGGVVFDAAGNLYGTTYGGGIVFSAVATLITIHSAVEGCLS